MDEIIEFFRGLFRYDQWPPRWKCGYWSDFHGWLYIISELMVWTAYFLIPLIIINYFYRRKTSIRFRRVYILFATFILLCGSTHFIDALMFWIPMYRLNALVRLATGVVSLFTVYHLFRVLPDVFKQRTNLELEREIARRQEVERKLEEANRGLEAFASAASHDLQEPLRKIRTFSSMLYEANEHHFDERSKMQCQKVIASADRMQALISDVLTLSTITEEVKLTEVDTNLAVGKAIENLELAISEKKATVQVGELPAVMGHEAYLTQLFYNLMSNALKFNGKTPVVLISGEQRDGTVRISVSDNGIGMKEEDYGRVFDAFQRLHAKSQYEGTGIGLAIVKRIVDVHHGTIGVDSRLGEGTTFFIELQAAEG
jgi:signal transduction histidine kinase